VKRPKTPALLGNVYRDLRDRHLLLPAIALIVAILAVPILLKSHATDNSAATPDANANSAATEAVPAVVTEDLGVTNYKKRLDRLQSKNPFHQQYAAPPPSAEAQAAPSASVPSTNGTSLAPTSSTPSSSSTSSLPPATGGTSSTVTSTTPSSGGTPPVTVHRTKPRARLYAWRASVKVGEPNKLQERPEVQRLAMLPSEGKPVVTFMGASEEGDQALFFVSRDVDSVKGDGRCLPNHSSCQFVVLKPGDKASFHYAPNGKRYNLVLVDVHAVAVNAKLRKKVKGDAQPQAKLPLLGPG
jgi:hypothetical protein